MARQPTRRNPKSIQPQPTPLLSASPTNPLAQPLGWKGPAKAGRAAVPSLCPDAAAATIPYPDIASAEVPHAEMGARKAALNTVFYPKISLDLTGIFRGST